MMYRDTPTHLDTADKKLLFCLYVTKVYIFRLISTKADFEIRFVCFFGFNPLKGFIGISTRLIGIFVKPLKRFNPLKGFIGISTPET